MIVNNLRVAGGRMLEPIYNFCDLIAASSSHPIEHDRAKKGIT